MFPRTAHWPYKDTEQWGKDCPQCKVTPSSLQSPIDIKTSDVIMMEMDELNFSNYNSVEDVTMELKNTGLTAKLEISGGGIKISGWGLDGEFIVDNLHFHWGSKNESGSEHRIDGKMYAMEMHIVHYNSKFPNVSTAAPERNGLAILAVLFEVSPKSNPQYEPIIEKLSNIQEPDSQVAVQTIPLRSLLPDNVHEFYRYQGSLTIPGCYETVMWTLFKTPIRMSENQLAKFRSLKSSEKDPATNMYLPLVDNIRPVQPLNGRMVYANVLDSSVAAANEGKKSLLKKLCCGLSSV